MKYEIAGSYTIKIDPEETPIKELLLTIAKVSYETAIPRELAYLDDPDIRSEEVDFAKNIVSRFGTDMLLMDYINGRDCRTKVHQERDGKLYFDTYTFEQRKIESYENIMGIVKDSADKFLDQVILELENK